MGSANIAYEFPQEFLANLDDVLQYDEIDSTNVEALRQIQAGKTGTRLLLAHNQSAGRGRRGRYWHSAPGAGIYLTLLRPFSVPPIELQSISLIAALSVRAALQEYGIAGVQLKWPNDLLVFGKKLAGILLELKQAHGENYVAFGIGINLALPAKTVEQIAQPVTDLTSLCPERVDKSEIVVLLIRRLLENLQTFENSRFVSFQADWNQFDCYLNQEVVLQLGETKLVGKSLGVDQNGNLRVLTASGEETINGGEVFPTLRAAESWSET